MTQDVRRNIVEQPDGLGVAEIEAFFIHTVRYLPRLSEIPVVS